MPCPQTRRMGTRRYHICRAPAFGNSEAQHVHRPAEAGTAQMERLPVELAPLRAVIVDRALEMPGTVARIRSRAVPAGVNARLAHVLLASRPNDDAPAAAFLRRREGTCTHHLRKRVLPGSAQKQTPRTRSHARAQMRYAPVSASFSTHAHSPTHERTIPEGS